MSLVELLNRSGNRISNFTIMSPFLLGSLGKGSPYPWIFLIVVGLITSSIRLRPTFRPSKVGISSMLPHKASLRDNLWVYTILDPSRVNTEWGLSRITKAISGGILPGILSPSRAKVILVPAFQPGLTVTVNTFSSQHLLLCLLMLHEFLFRWLHLPM